MNSTPENPEPDMIETAKGTIATTSLEPLETSHLDCEETEYTTALEEEMFADETENRCENESLNKHFVLVDRFNEEIDLHAYQDECKLLF